MTTIIIEEPTRLDTIVLKHYGTLEVLENVLIENSHILNKYILDVGDVIKLPVYEVVKEIEGGALWD